MKENQSRRDFLKTSALLTIAGTTIGLHGGDLLASAPGGAEGDPFTLPPLPYSYEALEPYIDFQTMQIHHDKHHQGYVNNLNKAVKEFNINVKKVEDLFPDVSKQPEAIRNNGGGHYNHSLFWQLMTPAGGGMPSGAIAEAINASFGSFTTFQEKFNAAAGSRFGSGWAWLVAKDRKLSIGSTPNQDNPLMDISELKGMPLMGIDVWEHAYYLKYQNKRADYIMAWWNLINWDTVNKQLALAK